MHYIVVKKVRCSKSTDCYEVGRDVDDIRYDVNRAYRRVEGYNRYIKCGCQVEVKEVSDQ